MKKNLILFTILLNITHSVFPVQVHISYIQPPKKMSHGFMVAASLGLYYLCSKYEKEYQKKQEGFDSSKLTDKEYYAYIKEDQWQRTQFKWIRRILGSVAFLYSARIAASFIKFPVFRFLQPGEMTREQALEVFGLLGNPTPGQIRKAFYKNARQWHPDRNKNNLDAAHIHMCDINAANDALKQNVT